MEAIIKETGERIKVWTNYYPTIYKEAVLHGGREFDEDEIELIIPPKPIDGPVKMEAIIKETGEHIKVWTNYYPTIYKEAIPHGGREFDEDEIELIIPQD